jgi:hypothetical protein
VFSDKAGAAHAQPSDDINTGLQRALWPSGWLAENEGLLAVSEN